MRAAYLIPAAFAAVLGLSACGEPSAEAPAAPAVPAPTLADLPAPYNAANLGEGEAQFNKCRSCHTIKARDGNLVGPNLHGVFERKPGSVPKFRYSEAMKAANFEAWTPEMVDHWLQKPTEFLPGTAMFFNGISKEEARRDLIAYLLIETRK
jgi:cytochrome c